MAYVDGFLIPLPKRNQADPKALPFDGQRMIYGGFKTFLEM